MDTLRPADLAARVLAWHNRHPLARRITATQVTSLGVVSLPFALRQPQADGAQPADPSRLALTPIFDARWMFGADARALDRFALAHGRYPLEAAAQWPWRQVDAELQRAHAADAAGLDGRTLRHLLCAEIEAGGQRSRVLVAADSPLQRAPVFGRRLYSPRRLAASAAALALLVLGGGWLLSQRAPAPMAVDAATPAMAASAAATSADRAAAHAFESPNLGALPEAGAASASTSSAAAAASAPSAASAAIDEPVHDAAQAITPAQQPVDVAPMMQDRQAAGPLVQIRPRLSEDERARAREQARALRPAPVGEVLGKGPAYALVTAPLPSLDDAQAQQALLQGLKAQLGGSQDTRLDLMRAGRRWRVVWWPHARTEEAQALRAAAAARGLKLEVVSF